MNTSQAVLEVDGEKPLIRPSEYAVGHVQIPFITDDARRFGSSQRLDMPANTGQAQEGEYRYVDASGNEFHYRCNAEGNAIITGCEAANPEVIVPKTLGGRAVVALAEEAFSSSRRVGGVADLKAFRRDNDIAFPIRHVGRLNARNAVLERVVLPHGLRAIGRAAFRGCANLAHIDVPATLEEIDDLAFSCTKLASITLPARCTRLSPRALRLGPETVSGAETVYRSKLEHINVHPSNPRYCMKGGLLCRSLGAGRFETVLCPGKAGNIEITCDVARIAPGTFSGTVSIESLCVSEGVEVMHELGLVCQASCEHLTIRFAQPIDGYNQVSIDMPDGALCHAVSESVRNEARLNAKMLLGAYDEALLGIGDRLVRTKLMVARLAAPVLLDSGVRAAYLDNLEPLLDSVFIQFGARGYWQGFEHLCDAGMLDGPRITRAISLFTSRGDTIASAYMLELKRRRFAKGAWDYAI